MKQLFQDNKSGAIEVVELPAPIPKAGTLLVRNVCSVISPGTERNTLSAARDSYLTTARNRPDLVARVVDMVKKDGVKAAWDKVQLKLSEPKALGYSSAGVVVAVGEGCGDYFRVGDRVACAGQGVASHAELVSVPTNLAARIPEGVSFDDAAFTTLGTIALHGLRQGDPRLGERWAVIGLGLVGQLCAQLLRAAGARVAVYDLDPALVQKGMDLGAEVGVAGGTSDQVASALAWTEGLGVDGVLVAAASSTDAPMISAGSMARDRATIVAVGFVPFSLPRDLAFSKELELKISRSYGPGRYDRGFEEKGFDYPAGYVRWTQTRNMEAFLHTLAAGQVQIQPLLTHRMPIEEAPAAYDDLMGEGGRKPLGMIIDYPDGEEDSGPGPLPPPLVAMHEQPSAAVSFPPVRGTLGVSFIGAGSFARGTLLPRFAKGRGVSMRGVVTNRGLSAHDAKEKFHFDFAGSDPEEILSDDRTQLVCIATRHDSHGDLVLRALQANKHVFVEKPLCLNTEELEAIEAAAQERDRLVLVGFNRRFSPMAQALRKATQGRGPTLTICRVNAGKLSNHWLQDPDIGGGRIIGEGCHFLDLLSYFAGDAALEDLQASSAGRAEGKAEDVVVQLRFSNGSVGQLLYTGLGNSAMGKERVEVYAGGVSGWIDDYNRASVFRGAEEEKIKGSGKGHAEEVEILLEALRQGGPAPIPFSVLSTVTRASFLVHRAIQGS